MPTDLLPNIISLELVCDNLLSPMVLAFVLGLIAVWVKSDLKLPDGAYAMMSYYLLLALGLKGGVALRGEAFSQVFLPVLAALGMGCILPLLAFFTAFKFGRFKRDDSAALAAHYGSVSVVTFMSSLVFLERAGDAADGFMTALVAILEIPGIVVALLLINSKKNNHKNTGFSRYFEIWDRIRTILVGKSILLLLGGLIIGYVSGPSGIKPILPFFGDPFKGILVLFLLDMGILAGQRLQDIPVMRGFLGLYAIMIPLLNASIAIIVGNLIGLSTGSTTTFATMAASASYIAAPAAVRMEIPKANPAIYLTAAIVITFPFNLAIGIPLYHMMTKFWFSLVS